MKLRIVSPQEFIVRSFVDIPDEDHAKAEPGLGGFMRDVVYLIVTAAFFLISIAYVKFCDRIR